MENSPFRHRKSYSWASKWRKAAENVKHWGKSCAGGSGLQVHLVFNITHAEIYFLIPTYNWWKCLGFYHVTIIRVIRVPGWWYSVLNSGWRICFLLFPSCGKIIFFLWFYELSETWIFRSSILQALPCLKSLDDEYLSGQDVVRLVDLPSCKCENEFQKGKKNFKTLKRLDAGVQRLNQVMRKIVDWRFEKLNETHPLFICGCFWKLFIKD